MARIHLEVRARISRRGVPSLAAEKEEMILYHHIEPDNYSDYGVTRNPRLPDDVSFIEGSPIDVALDTPLVFEVNYPTGEQPPHFIGDRIAVFSNQLVEVLRDAGVDNL